MVVGPHLRLWLRWTPCSRTYLACVAAFQHFFPQLLERTNRATGRETPGRPYCFTHTLTAGQGGNGPSSTVLYGGDAGRKLPAPWCSHRGRRQLVYKSFTQNRRILMFSYFSATQVAAPGFVLGPLTRGRGLSSIPQADTDRLWR